MQTKALIFFTVLIGSVILSCRQSHEPLAPVYTLSSNDSFPEGVTYDPIDRAFYTGSLQGGTITRVDADGTESSFLHFRQ